MARSEEEILAEVKALAVEYYHTTGKPLGVTGEVAEFEAARILGLELAPPRAPGYDAYQTDKRGRKRTVQIKGRWKKDGTNWGRVPSINTNHDFDCVVLVLLKGDYETFEIWQAERNGVIARLDAPGSKARNERRSMGVSQFKSIATRVWPD